MEAEYEADFEQWASEEESRFTVQLLEIGEGYHGDEVAARTGETWFGLFGNEHGSEVRRTKVIVKPAEDPVVDSPGEMTGKSVRVRGKDQPVFLFRNADFIKEGRVLTLSARSDRYDHNETFYLSNGFERTYRLGENEYRLWVTGGANSLRLNLSTGDTQQLVFSVAAIGDATWDLIWVGDIDGDGKLDLLANLPTFYNFGQTRLFVSSKADPGKLVKQVALFHTTGC
ncbi:MAG: VCBS repeat-containing protein [Pyrinomonadaceae bacterium]|nr:VCBS repeat-containing protein [Pyrinomonadaceae bacterium]